VINPLKIADATEAMLIVDDAEIVVAPLKVVVPETSARA
jgi:hypothetical protein